MRCPDLDELEAHASGSLGRERRVEIDEHLTSCPSCPDRLEDVFRNLALERRARALGGTRTAAEAKAPENLGGFRIVRELGRGGMGVVYLAEQERPRRLVALKVLASDATAGSARKRFRQEAEMLGRLQHPGIAQVYETGVADGRLYLAMEYVHGSRLDDYLARVSPDDDRKLRLFAGICDTVHHAHAHGVVHRDLKPGNILVEESQDPDAPPAPKVLDFGVAREMGTHLRELSLRTETGQILGTVPFMSPEQVSGASSDVDARSDVYALGVLGFWLMSGSLPHALRDRSVPEMARIIRDEEPAALSSVDRRYRGDVETILAKALEKDPDRRYQSASELAADIRRYLSDEPIVARPPSVAYQMGKLVSRHRIPFALAALAFALSVFSAVTMGVLFDRARKAERRARSEAESAARVSDFLVELFEAPDPLESGRRDVTAREILDRGVLRVRTSPIEDNEIRSTLLRTLGKTYARLGELDLAEELLLDAVALRDGQPDLSAEATADLATVARIRGEYARAESLHREAVEAFRAMPSAGNRALGMSLDGLGQDLRRLGRIKEAEATLEEAVAILDPDGDRGPLAGALEHLSWIRKEQGRIDEAEALLRRSLELRRAEHGDRHVEVATALANLAVLLDEKGEREASIAMMRDALHIQRELRGPDHPVVTLLSSNLGAVLLKSGNLDEAEPLLRDALDAHRRQLGDRHPDVAWRRHNLGVLLARKGEHESAVRHFEEAIRIRVEALPPEHWTTAESRSALGASLAALGRFEEAERLLVESEVVIRTARGADDRVSERARQRIADLYEAWGGPGKPDDRR